MKLQRTGNSGWLVCAAVLDCSRLLLIVAIEIAHAMLARQGLPHNAVHSSSNVYSNCDELPVSLISSTTQPVIFTAGMYTIIRSVKLVLD